MSSPPPGWTAEAWAAVESQIDKHTYTDETGEQVVDVDAFNADVRAQAPAIGDLALRAHEASVAKGFDPPRWGADEMYEANYLAKLMLVVTELDEVIRVDSKAALGEELSDIVLRVLPMLHCCHSPGLLTDLDYLVRERKKPVPYVASRLPYSWNEIGPWIRTCARAAECWRKDEANLAGLELHNLVLNTFFMADAYSIDLFAAVEAKMAKNAERPFRHGKKSTG